MIPSRPRRRLIHGAGVCALAVFIGFAWWHQRVSEARRSSSPQRIAGSAPASAPPPATTVLPEPSPTSIRPRPAAAAQTQASDTTPTANAALPGFKIDVYPRIPGSLLEAQIELARRGFSCGPVDGVAGNQTEKALRAFQETEGIDARGWFDSPTRARLQLARRPTRDTAVDPADLARLQPLSPTWLGKSEQSALEYATLLELLAERTHAHPNLLRQLNPGFDWDRPAAGATVTVPDVDRPPPRGRAAELRIFLGDRVLQARDADGAVLLHCPVSIARMAEKRPLGEMCITVAIRNPNYTFDPDVFPESAEGRELGRKLVLPPGPNNPVGLAWIGLDRPGYGIHGTPNPDKVGRTESHGCFRLANWDALALLDLVRVGLPVYVDP